MSAKRLFAVFESRGPAWDDRVRMDDQPDWDAHAALMDQFASEGFIVLGGPLEGTRDVLLVVRAQSEAELAERFAADPWIQKGLLVHVRTSPWWLRLGSLDR